MQNCENKSVAILAVIALLQVLGASGAAQSRPAVAPQYQNFFAQYVDNRSMLERSLNLVGMTQGDVGRSFALVAGVSHYPRLAPGSRELRPAESDRDQLVSYLEKEEFFDEVVVLWDEDMNIENLTYFLKEYFPKRLAQFPKSRFLFAYSGHGFAQGDDAYLIRSAATSLTDRKFTVALKDLRMLLDATVRSGYQVLVLLNSCYAGALLTSKTFGPYVPKHPGAHAITAGAAEEKAWSDSRIGTGSVFFEKVLTGLGGAADTQPTGGDGVITATELFAYLRREVQISTDERQSPQFGDLSAKQSEGEFFFLNRSRQTRAGLVPTWSPTLVKSFGADYHASSKGRSGAPPNESRIVAMSGELALEGKSFDMTLGGSFGNEIITGSGGSLRVEISLSTSKARYERIELQTAFADKKLSGSFAPGFGKTPVPIELNLSVGVAVSTSRPSDEYQLLPSSNGNFELGPFSTSDCGFTCYRLDVSGTWSASTPEHVFNGEIRGSLADRGIGADASATLDPKGYPGSVELRGFHWHGNSGGPSFEILNTTVDGIPIKLTATYVTFFATDNSNITLQAQSLP